MTHLGARMIECGQDNLGHKCFQVDQSGSDMLIHEALRGLPRELLKYTEATWRACSSTADSTRPIPKHVLFGTPL